MKRPVSLMVVGALLIVFAILRIGLGILGFLVLSGDPTIVTAFYTDNLAGGSLMLAGGIFSVAGKNIGRILSLLATLVIFIFYLLSTGFLGAVGYSLLPLILTVLLFTIPGISDYFKAKKDGRADDYEDL